MPPLSSVTIRNFKSLRDVSLEFGQLNIIIGENGSGKSNLLEAIGLLSTAVSGNMDYNRLAERGVRLSAPEVFKSSFKYIDRPKGIRIESIFGDSVKYAVSLLPEQGENRQNFYYKSESLFIEGVCVAGRSNNGARINGSPVKKPSPRTSILLAADSHGAFSQKYSELLDNISQYGIYAPSTPILRGVSVDDSRQAHLGLYGGSLALALSSLDPRSRRKITHYLKKMFKWIRAVGVMPPEPTLQSQFIHTGNRVVAFKDEFMKVNFNTLYAYDVSEGALYALFVLCLLFHRASPKVFSLDNIDSTLNPGLVTVLVQDMASYLDEWDDKQIFLTTHNPTTLDALDLFNPSHRLFVVERGEDGDSSVRRIVPPNGMDKEKWSSLVNNMKMSELWLSGALGALYRG